MGSEVHMNPRTVSNNVIVEIPPNLLLAIHEAAKKSSRSVVDEILGCLEARFNLETQPDWIRLVEKTRDIADDAARKSFLKAAEKSPANKPPISLKELARRIGMDRSSCRQYVLRLGYTPTKQRMADSRYQLALTVTADEALAIQSKRSSEGYCSAPR